MSKAPARSTLSTAWTVSAMAVLVLLAASPAAAQVKPGSLDLSFGMRGKVTHYATLSGGLRFALAPDGGVVVDIGGRTLVRYGSNGKLDRSFGEGGEVEEARLEEFENSHFQLAGVAVDSKGRVLVAGTTTPFPPRDVPAPTGCERPTSLTPESATVYRYTPQGKLDRSFGDNGVLTSNLGFQPPVLGEFHYEAPVVKLTGITVDSQDRPILTGTRVKEAQGCAGYGPLLESFVARLTPSGGLDHSFGEAGVRQNSSLPEADNPIFGPSGNLIYTGAKIPGGHPEGITLARLGEEGSLDPSFGSDGLVEVDPAAPEVFRSSDSQIALDHLGRIYVLGRVPEMNRVGETPGKTAVAEVRRFTPNGALDTSYGQDGTAALPLSFHGGLRSIAVDSHGRVLLSGTCGPKACEGCYRGPGKGHYSFDTVRLNPDGKADRTFGKHGAVITCFGGTAKATQVMIDHRGRIVVGGELNIKSPYAIDFALARYIP